MRPGLPPVRKSLGQHFLTDRGVLQKIVDAADIQPSETVVEIGPGRGALTDLLVERAGRLIAIEYDRALAAHLQAKYASRTNVEIVQADVLSVDIGAIAGGPYKLVGNVPYYITTPILFHALKRPRPALAIYLVQSEVADRVSSPPGSSEYGALTVNVGAVANAKTLFRVPSGAFRPPPKVESAVLRITPKAEPVIAPDLEEPFRAFVQSVFTMRRKQLQRIIRSVASLSAEEADRRLVSAGIDPMARPETLSVEEFARLFTSSFQDSRAPS